MASHDKRRNLRSWRNKRTALINAAKKSTEPTYCWLCKQEIDVHLPTTDRFSLTYDHVEAIAKQGHIMGQVLPAHKSCNSAKGDGTKMNPLQGATRDW